jgi:hypothetical protein
MSLRRLLINRFRLDKGLKMTISKGKTLVLLGFVARWGTGNAYVIKY